MALMSELPAGDALPSCSPWAAKVICRLQAQLAAAQRIHARR
jgi:hypothetical protein